MGPGLAQDEPLGLRPPEPRRMRFTRSLIVVRDMRFPVPGIGSPASSILQ